MVRVKFTVPGVPVAQGRPRVMRTKNGLSHTFMPDKTTDYQKLVRFEYIRQCGGQCFPDKSALIMQINFFMPIPKSALKRDLPKLQSETVRHIKRPDLSNLIKSIEDAVNGLAYPDDSQISGFDNSGKYYSANPRVEVEISDECLG